MKKALLAAVLSAFGVFVVADAGAPPALLRFGVTNGNATPGDCINILAANSSGVVATDSGTPCGGNAPANAPLLGTNSSSALTPITLGSNLSITSGVLNASSTASTAFSALTTSTNTSANMIVGTGASITTTGSGTVTATNTTGVNGAAVPASASVLASNGSGQIIAATSTGTGSNVLSNSPTLVTPALGTPSSVVLSNGTGLPLSTGITGLGTGIVSALASNVGSSGAPLIYGGALGTPSSGTLTNETGLPLSTGVTGTLPIANGGTGTASPGLVAGANVTITGSWPNQTINSSGGGSSAFSGLTSGTNTSAAMLVGSGASLGTTGSGTLTANALTSGIALGTPGSGVLTNETGLPLTTGVTGTLPVGNGGTGATSLAAANIPVQSGAITSGHCVQWATSTSITDSGGNCGSGGSSAFSALTSSTNTTAAMLVGTGASLGPTGSGTLTANALASGTALGTPASGTLTNVTGLPISTGVSGLGTGVATFLGTPTSANLAGALTDETGSGSAVFATSPTLVTPVLGTPTSVTLTNGTGLPISTGVSGLGTGIATFLATPTSANLATAMTNETGTGSLVFATSPTLVTPTLGAATASGLTLSSITGSTQCLHVNTSGVVSGTGSDCGSGGSTAFSGLTSGTNTAAAMVVGTGGSLATSGTGTIAATSLSALSGLPTEANQTVLGNGNGASATPVALTLAGNLVATGTTLGTTQLINSQTGTSYAVQTSDAGKLLTMSNASAVAVSLSQATTTGFTAGFSFDIQNLGAGTVTITPATSTINGASTLTIAQNRGCTVTSDGANYQVSACTALDSGGGSGTVTSVAMTVPSFLSVSGTPITTSGTLALTLSGTALPIANGGTGSTTLAGASIPVQSGSITTNDCVKWLSATSIGDAGSACGSGGGSGTVNSGTAGELAYYAATGTAVSTTPNASISAGALTLGASGTAGSLTLGNATSGTVTLAPVTGALGTVTASLPANTGTLAELNLAETWTAAQTFTNSDLKLLGSSTGATTFTSANASATAYTTTVPANTGTLAELNLAETWSAVQTFGTNISIGGTTATGATGTGNVVFGTSPTLTTPNLGTPSAVTLTNGTGLPVGGIAAIAANSVVMNATGSSASPTAVSTVTYLIDSGTQYTVSGTGACATTTKIGTTGTSVGSFTCTGTTGASTVTITLPLSTNGWHCSMDDQTTALTWRQTAYTTTSVTLTASASVTANDVQVFGPCAGF